jgi:hypothetical protein
MFFVKVCENRTMKPAEVFQDGKGGGRMMKGVN